LVTYTIFLFALFKFDTMKYWFNLGNWRYVIGSLFGAAAGYGYWYFYGCINGCTITGSPLNSTLYFAFMGYLLAGMFKSEQKKTA